MPDPVRLQILDIISCIDGGDRTDLEKLSHDEYNDPSINLYLDRNQRSLSAKNDQIIKMIGRTDGDQSILVNVVGFQPYFYLGFEGSITPNEANSIISWIKSKVSPRYQSHLVRWELVHRQPYERFVGGDKFPFIKMCFRNRYSFKEYERVALNERSIRLTNRTVGFYVGESNLDEVLRCIHQMDIQPTGWVEIEQYRTVTVKTAYVNMEIETNVRNVKPLNRISNSPFRIMIYDLECQSELGELGDFPVAKKDFQKLARELIDLWSSHRKHELIKNEVTFHRVLESCLNWAFSPDFYPYNMRQIKTVGNLKPTDTLIDQCATAIGGIYGSCQTRPLGECQDCLWAITDVLVKGLPEAENASSYFHLAKQLWSNLCNLEKSNRGGTMGGGTLVPPPDPPSFTGNGNGNGNVREETFSNHKERDVGLKERDFCPKEGGGLRGGLVPVQIAPEPAERSSPLRVMIGLAFDDYYDGFNFSPVNLKGKRRPGRTELNKLTPDIHRMICVDMEYAQKLKNLTNFLNERLQPMTPRGDPIIQIGFTFQRLGEAHPYLKGIYTVDSCASFTNEDLIHDENNTAFTPEECERIIRETNEKHGTTIGNKEELIGWMADQQAKGDRANVLIRSFTNEAAMIKAFGMLVNTENPDMVGGYNNFGFDDKYLVHRAEELNIAEAFLPKMSRLKHDMPSIQQPAGANRNRDNNKEGGSGACYGASSAVTGGTSVPPQGKRKMETHYLEMKGRISFDIYRIIPNSYNLPEYKLNSVCKHFLRKEKNDVPPTQIPVLQRGNAADRSLIARYCIIDCVLCNRLLSRLSIINNMIAMSNVSLVPIRYLLFRGQTIKGFSLIVKKCSQRDKVVKTLRADEKSIDMDKFEGAIVLDPLIDIYHYPVSVADFNSLYPSSMISENISNDTLVTDPKYDNLPGYHYNTVCYDEYVFQQAKHKRTGVPLKRREKIKKPDMKICRFVGNVKGILPEIEEELIASRKYAQKRQKEYAATDPSLAAAWDCQQLAYKITCNSIYGITGASVSPIYNKNVAASITATGRKMIIFSKNYVEQNYVDLPIKLSEAKICTSDVIVKTATCVYGDSVAGCTPVLIRSKGRVNYVEIQDLVDAYVRCDDGKEVAVPDGCEVWSDVGWTRIRHVVRHKTDKQIYRVCTHNGIVDVTEDHSLLDSDKNAIKPKNCLWSTLLSREPPEFEESHDSGVSSSLAWVIGLFVAGGCCESKCISGKTTSNWTIVNRDATLLEKAKSLLSDEHPDYDWKIIDGADSKRLVPKRCKIGLVRKWRDMCYYRESKIVPDVILSSPKDVRVSFLEGYIQGCDRSSVDCGNSISFDIKTQISASSFYNLCRNLGCGVRLGNSLKDEYDIYRLTVQMQGQPVCAAPDKVCGIIILPRPHDYVYDIETENHHFAAGIGNIVVHNTDSLFIKFDMVDANTGVPLQGKDAIFASMEICAKAAHEISLQLKSPQNLAFEKTICPFLLTNKKMYKGHYYKKMNSHVYEENTMGFPTKKRDSPNIAKIVIDELTDMMFSTDHSKMDQEMIGRFIIDRFKGILDGKYPQSDFIRTKSWKGHYANPDQIAQHVLAIRQAIRDPGNQFQINDRIPFIHIVNPKASLQGDKIETVEFANRNNLETDYRYYIEHLLINPLLKILSPNKKLGVTEQWLLNILKNLYQEKMHATTMDKHFSNQRKG